MRKIPRSQLASTYFKKLHFQSIRISLELLNTQTEYVFSQTNSDQIASRKCVLWIDCLFDSSQNIHSHISNALLHKFLAELADSVMMRDTASILHDLLTGSILDIAVDGDGVGQASINESEVHVDCGSSVVDLS